MQKRTREIAAIILLVMLGAGVAVAMGWYLLVGHNWNVTASNIDDSIGQMDGYTIFLYEGTLAQKQLVRAQSASKSSQASAEGTARKDDFDSGSSIQSAHSGVAAAEDDSVFDDLVASYREKGAAVFMLDLHDQQLYNDPFVVAKMGKRVGLFSISEPARIAAARVGVKLLARQNANFVVMMTDDPSLADTSIRGVDVLICSDCYSDPSGGRYVGSTYCVDAPYEGQIQAIIVSPSGVISSKLVETD